MLDMKRRETFSAVGDTLPCKRREEAEAGADPSIDHDHGDQPSVANAGHEWHCNPTLSLLLPPLRSPPSYARPAPFRLCSRERRCGRERLRQQSGETQRQRHRVHQLRAIASWKLASTAQGDRARWARVTLMFNPATTPGGGSITVSARVRTLSELKRTLRRVA
jgi:hypothetical protein